MTRQSIPLLASVAALALSACANTEPVADTLDAAPAAEASETAEAAVMDAADDAMAEAEAVAAEAAEAMDAADAIAPPMLPTPATYADILAADYRADDRPRDGFRNPADTLAFFGVTPDMTVAEYAPGGGWYARVLAPLVAEEGQYIAANHDIDAYLAGDDVDPERFANAKAFPETFPGRIAEATGLNAGKITAFEIDEAPADIAGTVDALLVFRSMHGLTSRGIEDDMAAHAFALLAPGGTLGIVQHRASADAPDDYADGSKGYLRQADVIANFEAAGFELVGTSEVNANPADTADHEGGVWTLPPVLRGGDAFADIGESDRMTLKFVKPEA